MNPDDGDKFRCELGLDRHQSVKYEMLAVPLTEGSVELGRTLTMEELKVRSQAAVRRMNAVPPKVNANKGKGKTKNWRK